MTVDRLRIEGREYLATGVAAAVLGVTPQTVRNLAAKGRLPSQRLQRGARSFVYVESTAVERYKQGTSVNPHRARDLDEGAHGASTTPGDQQRLRELELLVGTQSAAITHLLLASESESKAMSLMSEALEQHRDAQHHLRAAVRELATSINAKAIPKDLAGLQQQERRRQ